jgi:hypothetical protein
VTDDTAGRVAPRRTPSDIIAALLAELQPWAWREGSAADGQRRARAVEAETLWAQAQPVPVAPARLAIPRRTPRSR